MNIGYGRHFWDIRALSLSASKIQRLSSVDIVYGLVIYTIKVSILLLYYRLFSVYSSSRRLIYGGIAICTIITLPYLGMAIARAVVCSSFKVVLEHLTFCYTRPVNSSIVSFSAANVISDFYIFAVPISRVRRLHVDRKAKVGLLAVFIVGFVACGMSIIRLVFVAVHFDNSDVFYRGATVSIFSAVEMNLAIICSCSISFPAFYRCGKDALRPILQSITGRSDRQSSRTKSNPVNDFKLLAHGLLDGQVESKNESNTRVIETPPRAATVPPHISLHMTRATIDMEEHSSSRI
ncbi:hypothetical protein BDV95DRAFT_280713 [Massariosphaeria phaeospora]|uniref:Rhodopsin domain-containing protein n=1 Tax=Massariosphaeria phaeospora TaxID=100035 RepID=A0A7C8MHR3_9PLEO|nr:hypothetical protein BDV95DRAFT_280713 [Massariosphaeria phaeospora]